jgi:hypothetical protein
MFIVDREPYKTRIKIQLFTIKVCLRHLEDERDALLHAAWLKTLKYETSELSQILTDFLFDLKREKRGW